MCIGQLNDDDDDDEMKTDTDADTPCCQRKIHARSACLILILKLCAPAKAMPVF